MNIKPSTTLRNEYTNISNLAKETKEPIYITKNGEGDLVLMSIEAFEKREQTLQLRTKVLQAEQERIEGVETLSVSDARRRLRERLNDISGKHVAIYKKMLDNICIYHIADTRTQYTKLFY